MKLLHAFLIAAGAAGVLALSANALNGTAQEKTTAPQEAAMPVPKPTAEHQLLQKWVGTWDANVNAMGSTSKATFICRPLGQLWVIGDFKGDFAGMPFEGQQTMGYDPDKKKFSSVWVDSMSTNLSLGEGIWDAAAKKLTYKEKTMRDGKEVNSKTVCEWKDDNTVVFKMSEVGADGKDVEAMTIDYKRRK